MAEIKKIVLLLDEGTELALSLEEARRLYESLHRFFGARVMLQPLPPPSPLKIPLNPTYPYITCESTDAAT